MGIVDSVSWTLGILAVAAGVFVLYSRMRLPVLEAIFATTQTILVGLAGCSVGLLVIGSFNVWRALLAFAFVAPVLSFCIAAMMKTPDRERMSYSRRETLLVIGVVAAFLVFNGIFTTYYVRSGRDYGIYLMQMAQFSRVGSLDFTIPHLKTALEHYGPAIIRDAYPGVYNLARFGTPNEFVVQFLHAFSALGANLFQVGGVPWAARLNVFIGSSAILGLYILARHFTTRRTAFLIILAASINPVLVYNFRVTTSEIFSFSFFVAGAVFIMRSLNRKSFWPCVLAGFFLGLNQFNRLDNMLMIALIAPFCLVLRLDENSGQRLSLGMIGGFVVSTLSAILYSHVYSYPYLHDHLHVGLWGMIWASLAIFVFATIVCLIPSKTLGSFELRQRYFGFAVKCICGLVFLYIAKGLIYADPEAWEESIFSRSTRQLFWYLSICLLLLPVGVFSAISKRKWALSAVGLFVMAMTVLFTYHPAISPDHFWATRRWAPHVVPGVLLFAGYALYDMWLSANKLVRFSVPVIGLIYTSQAIAVYGPYWCVGMLQSLHSQIESATTEILAHPDKHPAYFLTGEPDIAGSLTFIYGVPSILLEILPEPWNAANSGKLGQAQFIGLDPKYGLFARESAEFACGTAARETVRNVPRGHKQVCFDLSYGSFPNSALSNYDVTVPATPSIVTCDPERACSATAEATTRAKGAKKGMIFDFKKVNLAKGDYRLEIRGEFRGHSECATFVRQIGGQEISVGREISSGINGIILEDFFRIESDPSKGLEYKYFIKVDCPDDSIERLSIDSVRFVRL